MRALRVLCLGYMVGCGSFGTSDRATTVDAGTSTPTDAGGDGTVDFPGPEAGAVDVPCIQRPLFADAFERPGTPVEQGWSKKKIDNGTTLTLSSSPKVSGTGSLRIDVSVPNAVTARLEKDLLASSCPVEVSFVFSPVSGVPTNKSSLVSVRYSAGEIELRLESGERLTLADDIDDGGSTARYPLGNVRIGDTYNIALTVDAVKKMVGYVVTGGLLNVNGSWPLDHSYGPPLAVWVGAEDASSANAFTYLIDDVSIR